MQPLESSPLHSLSLAVLISGLFAGSPAGRAARRRLQTAETETAAAPTALSSRPAATAPPSTSLADQTDAELHKMYAELDNSDTNNDFSTALPPDAVTATRPRRHP